MASEFGNHLCKVRKDFGISAAELARRAGLSKAYIHALEHGENCDPSMSTLQKLASALDLNLSAFIAPLDYSQSIATDDVLPFYNDEA